MEIQVFLGFESHPGKGKIGMMAKFVIKESPLPNPHVQVIFTFIN